MSSFDLCFGPAMFESVTTTHDIRYHLVTLNEMVTMEPTGNSENQSPRWDLNPRPSMIILTFDHVGGWLAAS